MNNQSQRDDFIESDHENQLYTIHYVQKVRIINQKKLNVYIKWKNYSKNESTWEDQNGLTNDNDWCILRNVRHCAQQQLQKLKQNSEPINGYSYSYDRDILDLCVFENEKQDVDNINYKQKNQQNQPPSRILGQVEPFTKYDDIFDLKSESNQELFQQKDKQQFQSEQRQQNILDTQISSQQKQQLKQDSDGSSQQSFESLQNKLLKKTQLYNLRNQQLNQQIQQLRQQCNEQAILKRQKQLLQNQLKQDSPQLFIQDLKKLLSEQQSQMVQQNLNNNHDIQREQIHNNQINQQHNDNSLQQFVQQNDQLQNNHQIYKQEQQYHAQITNYNQKKRAKFNITDVQEQQYMIIEDSVEQKIPSTQKSIQLSEDEVSQKQYPQEINKKPNKELQQLSSKIKINKVKNVRIKKIRKEKTDKQIYEQLKLKSYREELRSKYQTELAKMKDHFGNFIQLKTTYHKREQYGQIPNDRVSQIIQHSGYIKEVKTTKQLKITFVFEVKFEDPKLKNNYFKIYELFKHERELLYQYIQENQQELGFLTDMFNEYYKQKTELYDSLQIPLPDSDRID
ncbi:hypothetical protein pb186bvf_005434 [Paramecium bursaria]